MNYPYLSCVTVTILLPAPELLFLNFGYPTRKGMSTARKTSAAPSAFTVSDSASIRSVYSGPRLVRPASAVDALNRRSNSRGTHMLYATLF